jgi:hypothetical protein
MIPFCFPDLRKGTSGIILPECSLPKSKHWRRSNLFGKRQHQEQTADKTVQCANAFRAPLLRGILL